MTAALHVLEVSLHAEHFLEARILEALLGGLPLAIELGFQPRQANVPRNLNS